MVSCDLVSISGGICDESNFRDRIEELVQDLVLELKRENIMLNVTHTHVAPIVSATSVEDLYSISLG